jgi:hypothetical protein
MNLRTTLVLFGVLFACLLTFGAFQWLKVRTPEEARRLSKYVFTSLHEGKESPRPGDFDKLIIKRFQNDAGKAQQLEFVREPSGWKLVAPKAVRTDANSVENLIRQITDAEKLKAADLSRNPSDYGLDKPSTEITLVKSGKNVVLKLGQEGPGKDPVIYGLSSDLSDRPIALQKSRLDKVFADLEEFRDKNLLGSAFDYQAVKLTGKDRQPLELEKVDNKDWKFKEPKYGLADFNGVNAFTNELAGIRVGRNQDFVADGKLDEAALAKYGLAPDKETYNLTVVRKDPADTTKTVTEVLRIGAKDDSEEPATALGRPARLVAGFLGNVTGLEGFVVPSVAEGTAKAEMKDHLGYYFAKLAGDDTIVRIPARHGVLFAKKAEELRSRALAKLETAQVDAINLFTRGETLRLRVPVLKDNTPSEWDLYSDHRAKTKTHVKKVAQLVDALNKVEVQDFTGFLDSSDRQREWFKDQPVDFGFDKPHAEITVWTKALVRDKDGKVEGDGEPKLKEDVAGKPTIKLTIGKKDEKRGIVYVRREQPDLAPTIMAVPDPWLSANAALPGEDPAIPTQRETISLTSLTGTGYLGLRDHSLPSFTVEQAAKFTYQRPGEVYEVVHEEKKDDKGTTTSAWVIKKPIEATSPTADQLLRQLTTLDASKLVSDRATDRDLEELFGLGSKAPLRVTVTTKPDAKDKVATYTYTVGKATPADHKHPQHYFARVELAPGEGSAPESNAFVFLIPQTTVQVLDAELRDSQILTSDLIGKIAEATLTWNDKDKDGKPRRSVLTLERGGDKKSWTIKALTVNGADAKALLPTLDQPKLDRLLGLGSTASGPTLLPMFTDRFVVTMGKPDAKLRLDPAANDHAPTMIVAFKLEDGKTVQLVIGERFETKDLVLPRLKGRNYYYATASTVADAVFLLADGIVNPLLVGPDYFKPTPAPVSSAK